MLTAGAGAPKPKRPHKSSAAPASGSTSRLRGAVIGLTVVLVAAVLYFSLRGGQSAPAPAGPRSSARSDTESVPTTTPSAAPAKPRAARTSALRPPPRASAEPAAALDAQAPQLKPGDVSDPALKAVLAARDDRSPNGTQVLIDNLGSGDEILVAEATKALIARKATEAIAPLAAISLAKAAGGGLSVIDALGKLGGVAEGDDKRAAVDRLLQMLRDEKRRQARESPGNLLQIYEALGDTQDPEAAPALEAELLDANVPRAPKVVIVQALVDIGLASSKEALGKAQREQSAQRGDDAFEEEIRKELVGKLQEALESL